MLLYMNDCFTQHRTGSHPECTARIERVNALLREQGWIERCPCPAWTPATAEQILRVHDADYMQQLEQWCAGNAGRIEADTIVSQGSWRAALMAAGAVCDAVNRVIAGEEKTAFCAIRPPGHHALPTGPMGFCLFNNVAVGARAALAAGLERVMIIDWDVHHGNGTQDAFYGDGRVAFFSIHRSPFYPGTGATSETGTGAGLGWISNAPVPATIQPLDFFRTFDRGIEDLAAKAKPQLILLSAGFDAHVADPVGSLCLVEEDFAQLTHHVKQLADTYCDGKIVSLLEGGYHLDHMPQSVLAHVKALDQTRSDHE